MKNFTLLEDDLSKILEKAVTPLQSLKNTHIFITGARGFFGVWLIEALLFANTSKQLNITIYALTRSKADFYAMYPHFQSFEHLKIVEGTVLEYSYNFQSIDYIIHAANLPYYPSSTWATDHINYGIQGTQNIFHLAKKYHVKSLLITSSGAVYRNFYTPTNNPLKEDELFLNTKEASVYAETKKVIEQLTHDFYEQTQIPCSIARCFALAGAHLPLEKFALGNFIQNALNKKTISIMGTGEATRSYMYGSDLVIWLLTILVNAKNLHTYNVGSDEPFTIKELASLIADRYKLDIVIYGNKDTGNAPAQYIPNIEQAKKALNLDISLSLLEMVEKMYDWNKKNV